MRRHNRLTDHTITIADEPLRVYDAEVPPQWEEIALEKGFDIVARVKDRYHLALRCHDCGELTCAKAFVVRTAEPRCPSCLHQQWCGEANAAGLTFLRRDPASTQYFMFRAPCGHEVRRQLELVRRIGEGEVELRCETCLVATEAAEATARGWTRLGPDPVGDANYRIYQHGCGHTQRVARANMQTGRFGCGRCDPGWPAAPSWLYAMRFHLSDGQPVVKLGFSRDPVSRLRFQLARDLAQDCALLRQVGMPTGQIARQVEKRLHKHLRQQWPDAVVAPERFTEVINVGSEIYENWLELVILKLLDDLDGGSIPDASGTGGTGTADGTPLADPGEDCAPGGDAAAMDAAARPGAPPRTDSDDSDGSC